MPSGHITPGELSQGNRANSSRCQGFYDLNGLTHGNSMVEGRRGLFGLTNGNGITNDNGFTNGNYPFQRRLRPTNEIDYRTSLVTVLIVILLMATSSILALPEKRSDLDPEPKNHIRIETDRDVYEKGEDVIIKLFLVNTLNESVTYTFNNTINGTYQ